MRLLHSLFSYSLLTIVMLSLLPLGITYYSWDMSTENLKETNQAKFYALTRDNQKAFLYRMESYKQSLLGGKGFFRGSQHISRDEWKHYVESIDVLENFPGINGIGVIDDVKSQDLGDYITEVQKDGVPDFSVHPTGNYPANFIIKFIEPSNINKEAIGLNIAFEKNRFEAAVKAKKTGKAAITKRIFLVQDNEKSPGFLLLLPNYKKNMPLSTIEERQKAFKNWIYAPFIGKNFMKNLTSSQGELFQLRVYDGTKADADRIIYDSNPDTQNREAKFIFKEQIEVMQQQWLLVWSSTESFERNEETQEPFLVLLLGLLFSIIFIAFVVAISVHNNQESVSSIMHFIIPLIALSLIVLGSWLLQREIVHNEKKFIRYSVEQKANIIKNLINQAVASKVYSLNILAKSVEVHQSNYIPYEHKDVQYLLKNDPSIRSLKRINNDNSLAWTEPASLPDYEAANIVTDPHIAKILKTASQQKEIVAFQIQDTNNFELYLPVIVNGVFDGFISSYIDMNKLMEFTIPKDYTNDFRIELVHQNKRYYQEDNPNLFDKQYQITKILPIYDTQWVMSFMPTEQYLEKKSYLLANIIVPVGILVGVLVALTINFAQRVSLKSTVIRQKELLLSNFIKQTPAAVAMFDKKMRYIAVSDRWYDDYKIRGKNIIGKTHYEVFPEIDQHHPEWRTMHQRALVGEVIKENEVAFERIDGTQDWLRYELHPWYINGNESAGIIMFTENISERKQMDIMKNEFISTVNHELRTPLTSIQGALGLLRLHQYAMNEKGRRLLDLALSNTERLTLLVNDILDMEKIAAGKMEYRLEPCEMIGRIKQVVENNYTYADKFNINFAYSHDLDEAICYVDKNRFDQALINLLSNAAKFSPEQEIVEIHATLHENQLMISVADRGAGIPKSFHEKIFSKFSQADSSSTRGQEGTGLGLHITRSIIQAFNGTITFESEEGNGTIFYITLPISKTGAD